jgi:citronellol/citronellal dehydrogenase
MAPDLRGAVPGAYPLRRATKTPANQQSPDTEEDRMTTPGTPSGTLTGKTLFITGASRGIGLAIALRAARDGANIAIAAKTAEPTPKLEGTIYTAAKEIEAAGGKALPIVCDIRFEDQVQAAVAKTVETFGGLDICVNNASAISLTPSTATEMKRYDLMHGINARGTFLVSKTCIPHLKQAANPHILMLSPPLDMAPKWFAPHVAYTMAKFNMSIIALGLSGELKPYGIAVNTLWPRTTIATAAVNNLLGGDALMRRSRKPEIMGDAAHLILTQDAKTFTGRFSIDDTLLYEHGARDFEKYRVDPSLELAPDFFVPDSIPPPPGVTLAARMR